MIDGFTTYEYVVGHKPGEKNEGFGGTIYIWVQADVERY